MPQSTRPIRLKRSRRWAPRPAIAPEAQRAGDEFLVASNGSAGCYGGWELVYPAPAAGNWVRFRIKARWHDLARGYDCVNVALTWLNSRRQMVGWQPLLPARATRRYVTYEGSSPAPEGARWAVPRLLIACSSRGEIRFSDPELQRTAAPRPRRMRLGAGGGPLPPGKRTVRKNTEFYLNMCREAARQDIALLCLPEIMLSWGIQIEPEALPRAAMRVPGKETAPFQQLARRHRMALCFSVLEKNAELVHNTAILIDKQGDIAGRYRKVHLAQPNEIWRGITPGHDFPVFSLGNAKVAMNICMDSSALESVRVPARKGAEIVCLPIMGDHRASTCWYEPRHDFDIERWRMIQCMRAMDNHVHMVVSRNSGYGTGVFSPRGEVLAIAGGRRVVWADVDLEDLPTTGGGATFKGVCWYERREPAYAHMSGSFLPEPS
ncbi:MAG: carbon-nitrogen hydrolase family protein [Armatimonadota bacterium]|jgi:predicted amidohydrolase